MAKGEMVKVEKDSKVNSYYHLVKQENYSTVNSSYHLVKREKNCKDGIDRLSILPDELLVSILSFLTLKEATATSILSQRWRYLWTLLPKLDFDGMESFSKLSDYPSEKELDEQRSNYVEWVDDVISAMIPLSSIEEFRVFFNLTRAHESSIDKWLRYVVADNEGKIRKLELKLVNKYSMRRREYNKCYTFPDELISSGNNFELLKSLSLHYVNVDGEALELLLRNSRHLEELSVSRSGYLSALKIISPFPSFKRLEISCCLNLNSVEIHDAKIVYLKYKGFRIRHFVMENVPLLVELFIGGVLTECMSHVLSMFGSYLPQLEIFKIDFLTPMYCKDIAEFRSPVKMINLKQLVVQLWVDDDKDASLLPFTSLIRASPCLQKFVLEASHWHSDFERITSTRRTTETMRQPYRRLEVVELVGYRGAVCELELITHFVKNAVALKQIRIDPHFRDDDDDEYSSDPESLENEMSARDGAHKQLTKIVPPKINLKIL